MRALLFIIVMAQMVTFVDFAWAEADVVVRYNFRNKNYEMPADEAALKQILGDRYNESVVKKVYDQLQGNAKLKERVEQLYEMRPPKSERIYITITHQSDGSYARFADKEVTIDEQGESQTEDIEFTTLLTHEFAHVVDPTTTSLKQSEYGPDGEHTYNEITTRHAAWCEGWAQYNEALVDAAVIFTYDGTVGNLRKEDSSGIKKKDNPTLEDYLSTEAIVAGILYGISDKGTNVGPVDETFNHPGDKPTERDIQSFLITYLELPSADKLRAIISYDLMTNFTAAEDQLESIFGPVLTKKYVAKRKDISDGYAKEKSAKGYSITRFDYIATAIEMFGASADGNVYAEATTDETLGKKEEQGEPMELVGTLSNF